MIQEKFDVDALTETLVGETGDAVIARQNPDRWVVDAYAQDPATYWRHAVERKVDQRIEPLDGRLRDRVAELLHDRIDQLGGAA